MKAISEHDMTRGAVLIAGFYFGRMAFDAYGLHFGSCMDVNPACRSTVMVTMLPWPAVKFPCHLSPASVLPQIREKGSKEGGKLGPQFCVLDDGGKKKLRRDAKMSRKRYEPN